MLVQHLQLAKVVRVRALLDNDDEEDKNAEVEVEVVLYEHISFQHIQRALNYIKH